MVTAIFATLQRFIVLAHLTGHPVDVAAAMWLETRALDAELLLAVARIESRFDSSATSRIEQGQRKTGSAPAWPPAGRGPRFCGVLQTQAGMVWADCLAQRGLRGWAIGQRELGQWLKTCRGDVRCALSGHGCGNVGAKLRTCGKVDYAARALGFAQFLRRAVLRGNHAKSNNRVTAGTLATHSAMQTLHSSRRGGV